MMPDLPKRDTAEWAGWCAESHVHRLATCVEDGQWWADFDCDVSLWWDYTRDSTREDFYVHFGGGSLNHRSDVKAWIAAARKALGL